jgi:hypothetical protein
VRTLSRRFLRPISSGFCSRSSRSRARVRGARFPGSPPANGLIIRGYCTYLRLDDKKSIVRSSEYYYKENPDRWMAETQSDLLWLTEAEWKSLIPANPKSGDRSEVAQAIQKRFYSTIGIDYMEGSVSALPTRKLTMSLTVQQVDDKMLVLRLDGYAHLGKEFDLKLRSEPRSRGCELPSGARHGTPSTPLAARRSQ